MISRNLPCNNQDALRASAGDEDVLDDDENENDITIQDVLKNGWEKVKETKDMNKKYLAVENKQQADIEAYKNHLDTLKFQIAQKKEEKKLKKKQRKEMLELSNTQVRAQEEQSAAYIPVKNNHQKINEYIAQIADLQQEAEALENDDSDDDESDNSCGGDEDVQIINEGGVFSSTQNDAAEVTPEKSNGAAKKKRKRRPAPNKDAAPSRDSAVDIRLVTPSAPTAETTSKSQPDFSSFIRAMELDQMRRNVEKVRPKSVFVRYDAKNRNEYNNNMCQFDKAFGKKDGITGSEKLTELAGHWFSGEAQKAIAAAKATDNDANGDRAYASVQKNLDRIFGQENDTAADALTRLKKATSLQKTASSLIKNFI